MPFIYDSVAAYFVGPPSGLLQWINTRCRARCLRRVAYPRPPWSKAACWLSAQCEKNLLPL